MSAPDFNDLLQILYADDESKRRYAQNSLIVDVAVTLNKGLSIAGINQKTLAERLGKTEGFVSQVLSGGSNLTLRTLADFAYSMNCAIDVALRHQGIVRSAWTQNTSIENAVVAVGVPSVLDEGSDENCIPAANADYALAA